jgi:heme-degrading monooxygenase HmoA
MEEAGAAFSFWWLASFTRVRRAGLSLPLSGFRSHDRWRSCSYKNRVSSVLRWDMAHAACENGTRRRANRPVKHERLAEILGENPVDPQEQLRELSWRWSSAPACSVQTVSVKVRMRE